MKVSFGNMSARRSRQSGLAMVESAIVLPLIIFLMLATAEVGRAISQYNTLTKALRDGTRFLTNSPTNEAGVAQPTAAKKLSARNLVVFGNTAGTGASILPGMTLANVANPIVVNDRYIRITATYTFQSMFASLPALGLGVGGGIAIPQFNASVTMRNLRV